MSEKVASGSAVVAGKRARRARSEAARDEAWLRWLARFRFVTAEALAEQFGVSRRRANARLERLEAAGLVVRLAAGDRSAPRAARLTRRASDALGLPRRRLPRTVEANTVAHELAVITCVGALETEAAARGHLAARVLSERECRRAEAEDRGRYSVACRGLGNAAGRWPDVVLEVPDAPAYAFEIEFAAKGARRPRQIIDGYRDTPRYGAVTWFADTPAVAARIARIAVEQGASGCVRVHPWIGLDATARARVQRAAASAAAGAATDARAA